MASIAQLNVSIGARIAELQKGLRQAERELRVSGQKFSRAGAEISTGLSIPLALAGAGAIKAAGDMESLTLALQSQLGSVEAAKKEFELLNAAAKNPGLGVEQAVAGSIRLQGVKFSAEEARKVLIEMGNAIARTGGTAENLDSVTKQFAQMSAKGRVLQEDISVLSENMPALAGLMEKAFGTTNVEAIRAMGVSGKEFVLQITKAAEALPRVEGGIKNSIGNALDSLKQSAAKVGLAINEAFNVTGAIETFAGYLQTIATAFSNLDPVAQKTILSILGIAVAIGPILKVIGAVQLLRSQMISAVEGMVSAAKSLAGGVLSAAKAFQALSIAQKATVIGLAIAAVTALYFAYDSYSNSLTNAEAAQKAVNDVTREAISSTEVERAKIGTLVSVLEDNTRSLNDKQGALKQLKAISPAYFGDLDIEKGKIVGLTSAVDLYVNSLERSAIVKQATEELAKQSEILRNIGESGAPTVLQQTGNALQAFGTGLLGGIATIGITTKETFDNLNAATRTFNQLDLQSSTQAKIDSLRALIKENIDLSGTTEITTKSFERQGGSTDKLSAKAKVLVEVLSDVENASEGAMLLGDDGDIAKLNALEKGILRLIDAGFKPASLEVQALKKELDELTKAPKPIVVDVIKKAGAGGPVTGPVSSLTPEGDSTATAPPLQDIATPYTEAQQALIGYAEALAYANGIQQQINTSTFDFATGLSEVLAKLTEQGNLMGSVFVGMGDAIGKAAADGATSFAQLGKAAAGAAAKIVRGYIQQGVAAAVAKALSSIPFPFNLAAGAAAGGLAAALFTNLIGKIGVKGFAAGTRDAPGGMALVGERGPEILNIPKHSQIFSAGQTATALRGSGSNVNVSGEFRIQGTDLVLLLERTNNRLNRVR